MDERRIVLVVHSDEEYARVLCERLERMGCTTCTARTGDEAMRLGDRQRIRAALVETSLPDGDGLRVLDYLSRYQPSCAVILLAGEASVEAAVDAMRRGARDYLVKPVEMERLVRALWDMAGRRGVSEGDMSSSGREGGATGADGIVGKSALMQQLFRVMDRVAQADATVLITGESGTGKELVAQAIHRRSARAGKPFVPVNCGAIPEELLESEFFGHEKGAFSGAIRTKVGRFEIAQGGTIFLDEIGEMSAKLQVKLLRFLQERSFERVGGIRPIEVDVRVIAAANKDLWKAVQEGSFREDLFYRLHVVPIHIPPLRERREDIPLLVEYFLERHCRRRGWEKKRVSPRVIECFLNYPWPGNVRELENLVERLVILSDGGEITEGDLPERFRTSRIPRVDSGLLKLPEEGLDLKRVLEEIERGFILQALERTAGVKNQAAKLH